MPKAITHKEQITVPISTDTMKRDRESAQVGQSSSHRGVNPLVSANFRDDEVADVIYERDDGWKVKIVHHGVDDFSIICGEEIVYEHVGPGYYEHGEPGTPEFYWINIDHKVPLG